MRKTFHRQEEGQILLWVALVAGLLIIFTAMAVDMGNIYYHKARLSNAVDAAVLTGVKIYGQIDNNGQQITQARAQQYADDVFLANYGDSSPLRAYTWCPIDVVGCPASPALSLTLKATQAPVNTSFMAYWPQWAQWHLGDIATATRSILVMSLILDRSGSMCGNGTTCWEGQTGDNGGVALQAAVPNFVTDFIQGTDYLSLISFASDARVDVPITQNFVTPIDNAVSTMNFDGGTFGTGGGTTPCPTTGVNSTNCPPMSLADNQNAAGVASAGVGSPITKVVIYFTDGLMNTIQDTLPCTNTPPGGTLYNFGGKDSSAGNGPAAFDFLDPNGNFQGSNDHYPNDDYSAIYGCGGDSSCQCSPSGCSGNCGGGLTCSGGHTYVPLSAALSCQGVTTFFSQQSQSQVTFSRSAITAEAQYRAITTANTMRQEAPFATYFYVIGLGNSVSGSLATKQFLNTLANDPNGPSLYSCGTGAYPPSTNCYNSNLPAGLFLIVPDCPSTACTTELNTAFQTIASAIRLRLSL